MPKPERKYPTREQLADIPEVDFTKAKVVRRGPKDPLGARLPLKSIRIGADKTQAEIAASAEMDQGDVSRLEARDDAKLSTLKRYARALGAELDIVLTFPKTGHRFRVEL